MRKLLKILKWTGIVPLGIIIFLLIIRFIGKLYYSRTPDGGINEVMYIDVNGQAQWINIYGEDRNNPVLLYLHGGPSDSTSYADWIVLRKLANDYTVVNWDQRDCGLTGIHDPQHTAITPEMMRIDIDCVTDYILDYMNKDKLTIMGMSWGTMYGGDYAARHPEKVDTLILLSVAADAFENDYINQAILDYTEGRIDFRTAVDSYGYELFVYNNAPYDATKNISLQKKYWEGNKLAWLELTEHDEKYRALLENYDPSVYADYFHDTENKELERKTIETENIERKLQKHYNYNPFGDLSSLVRDADYSLAAAVFFNPYYSISDWLQFGNFSYGDGIVDRLLADFSLSDITDFEMPVYVLQGDRDCHCGADQKYFEQLNAPDKEFHTIKGGHSSTLLHSEELAHFIHEITEKQLNSD